jgi:hypothetical protein
MPANHPLANDRPAKESFHPEALIRESISHFETSAPRRRLFHTATPTALRTIKRIFLSFQSTNRLAS